MKTKHWAENLLDGRHLFRYEIEAIKTVDYQINDLQEKLNKLKREKELRENEIFNKVRNENFSIEEITEAKEQNQYA